MEYHSFGTNNILVYVNDMTEGTSSYINLFKDDAKLLREIRNHKDCKELQNDMNKIYEWSEIWEIKFNVKESHVLEIRKGGMKSTYNIPKHIISIEK